MAPTLAYYASVDPTLWQAGGATALFIAGFGAAGYATERDLSAIAGYVVLPAAGLYKPIWEYDAKTLAKDLSAHLAYGAGTGAAFWLLRRQGRGGPSPAQVTATP